MRIESSLLKVGSWINGINSVHKIILSFLHGISYFIFLCMLLLRKPLNLLKVVVFLWLNFSIFWNAGHQY